MATILELPESELLDWFETGHRPNARPVAPHLTGATLSSLLPYIEAGDVDAASAALAIAKRCGSYGLTDRFCLALFTAICVAPPDVDVSELTRIHSDAFALQRHQFASRLRRAASEVTR